jgi:protein-L-isoaspartate(D-aspartate) O-methyltransferase
MTQSLELTGQEKALEIGTGSGYQTAILAELAREVHSTERLPVLADRAQQTLSRLGYANIHLHPAEESIGWAKAAPYDAIIVTAGAPAVPPALLDQLTPGGRLVIPVGGRWEQELLKITRLPLRLITENLGGCRFVPLRGKGGWDESPEG